MTNGEKIKQIFPGLQTDKGELEVDLWTTAHDAIDIPLEWWEAEYKEPTSKNDLTGDCISRQGVIDLAEWFDLNKQHFCVANLIDEVENMPSVTPQPKHGIWQQINKNEVNVIPEYRCSNCGAEFKGFGFDFDYCPRCGSVMEDEE